MDRPPPDPRKLLDQWEEWERGEEFLIEDGIQCETCHGPGSEYIDEAVMRDRELAMQRGLRLPTERTCMICHSPKGSHEAVLEAKPYVVEEALQRIAHPRPASPIVPAGSGTGEPQGLLGTSEHRFLGVGHEGGHTRLRGVTLGATELFEGDLFARDRLHDVGTRDEHERGPADHENEIGHGR